MWRCAKATLAVSCTFYSSIVTKQEEQGTKAWPAASEKKKGCCSFVLRHHLRIGFLPGEAAGYCAHSIGLVLVWYFLCL